MTITPFGTSNCTGDRLAKTIESETVHNLLAAMVLEQRDLVRESMPRESREAQVQMCRGMLLDQIESCIREKRIDGAKADTLRGAVLALYSRAFDEVHGVPL